MYDGKANHELWIMLYETAIRAANGNKYVMANYLPVVLDEASNQWLLSLREDSIDSWAELRRAFIDNFMATCEQPSTKYDLEKIRDHENEPLCDYIQRFSDMRLTIANITTDETINAFIHGLHHHPEFRSKLLYKWPRTCHGTVQIIRAQVQKQSPK
jgi:hypothetical protein